MENIYVGVSGINAVDNPGPGIGVARSLKEDRGPEGADRGSGLRRHGAGDLHGLGRRQVVPPAVSLRAAARPISIAFCTSRGVWAGRGRAEPGRRVAVLHQVRRRSLPRAASAPSCRASPNSALRGKDRLAELGEKIGISVPKTETVTSHAALVEAMTKIGLPVMVKGCFYKAYRRTPSPRRRPITTSWSPSGDTRSSSRRWSPATN